MKRFAMFLAMVLAALGVSMVTTDKVSARPPYKSRLDDLTKDSKAVELVKEHKCNVCHFVSDKKKRNDFGMAVNKHIAKKDFDDLKSDKAKLDKKIEDAIKAAFKEKSPEGKTYGELMESGQLPAKIVK